MCVLCCMLLCALCIGRYVPTTTTLHNGLEWCCVRCLLIMRFMFEIKKKKKIPYQSPSFLLYFFTIIIIYCKRSYYTRWRRYNIDTPENRELQIPLNIVEIHSCGKQKFDDNIFNIFSFITKNSNQLYVDLSRYMYFVFPPSMCTSWTIDFCIIH